MNDDSLFEHFFENAPISMAIIENDLISLANKEMHSLFQYDSDELIGKKFKTLYSKEKKKAFSMTPTTESLYGLKKNGDRVSIKILSKTIEKKNKTFVVKSVIDITPIQKIHEWVKIIIKASPQGMLLVDHKGTIMAANGKSEAIFGYTEDELLGKPIELLVPEQYQPDHPTLVQSYMDFPEIRPMIGMDRSVFALHRNKKHIPVEVGLFPLHIDNDLFVITTASDISNRHMIEKEIMDKYKELEKLSLRIAHDFKAPLLSMYGLADCIIEDLKEHQYSDVMDNAQKIHRACTVLQQSLDNTIMLSKIHIDTANDAIFNFESYMLSSKQKYSKILQLNQVEITSRLNHQRPLIGPTSSIIQILNNLLHNAIKYHSKKRKKRYVELHTSNDENFFHLQIKDNGAGIDPKKKDHITRIFEQNDEKELKEGSSLGLYVVKKLLNKSNGDISFVSSQKGTTFHLKFPIN